jgi:hypothetical protein
MVIKSGYIFLSYRRLEVALATKLTTDLKALGIYIWMDTLEIRPADDWADALAKGVDDCTAMIALISPEYLKSAYCCRELHRADRLHRVIFPLLLSPIDTLNLPLELERTQYLDFSDWQTETRYAEELCKLVEAIQRRFGNTVKIASEAETVVSKTLADTQPLTPIDPITEMIPVASLTDDAPAMDTKPLNDIWNRLCTGTWDDRQTAARDLRDYAIALNGVCSTPVLQHLIGMLRDKDWMVRWATLEAIAWVRAKDAKQHIVALLTDKHQAVRMTAVRTLALLGDSTDAETILPLLTDKNGMVREAVIQALGALKNPATIPALLPLLSDSEEEICLYAIESLGKIGDVSVVDALINTLRNGNEKIQWLCIEALGRLGDARAIPVLRSCMDDMRHPVWDEKPICDIAVESLQAINTPEALAVIANWQKKQPSPTQSTTQ